MKARDGEGVQRGWTRVVGLTATAIMTAFAIVHDNLRMVRTWARRTGFQSDDILLSRDRAIAGYEEIPLDDDEPPAALSPPTTA